MLQTLQWLLSDLIMLNIISMMSDTKFQATHLKLFNLSSLSCIATIDQDSLPRNPPAIGH